MKKLFCGILILVFVTKAISQKTHLVLDSIIQEFGDSLQRIESITYSATMLTKKFKSEEFKEKKFDVFASRNKSNKGYNFDWEIVEYKNDSEQRYIFVGKEFFYVNKKYKTIGYSNNVKKLSDGDYFENMRFNTLFDEIIYDFKSFYSGKLINILNQENFDDKIQIKISIDSIQDRIVTLDESFIPTTVKNVVQYKEMNLTQIIETKLSNVNINVPFPDSVLMPQYYLNQEYTVKYQEQEKDSTSQDTIKTLSKSEINHFFNFPIINVEGDTTELSNISGELFLIDFWFMSCIPCLKGMPILQNLSEKYANKGLRVIGINCHDSLNKDNVVKKINESGITYKNYFADKSMLQLLNINAFPTFLIIDKEMNLRFLGVGIGKDFDLLIEEEIRKLK